MLNQNSWEISLNIAKRASFSPDLGILLCTARDRRASVVLRWCTWPRWRRPGWWNSKTAKQKMLIEGRPEKTKHIQLVNFVFVSLDWDNTSLFSQFVEFKHATFYIGNIVLSTRWLCDLFLTIFPHQNCDALTCFTLWAAIVNDFWLCYALIRVLCSCKSVQAWRYFIIKLFI
jgi:hypothetical protein